LDALSHPAVLPIVRLNGKKTCNYFQDLSCPDGFFPNALLVTLACGVPNRKSFKTREGYPARAGRTPAKSRKLLHLHVKNGAPQVTGCR
jgi:hypothetical protein